MKKAKIYYYNFPTFANKDEKLAKVKQTKFANIPFELIKPDKNANWINQTDNDFDDLLPLCSKDVKRGKSEEAVFQLYCGGYKTNRDEWVFDFEKDNLLNKVQFFIEKYNNQIESGKIDNEKLDYSIKWSRDLKNKLYKKIKITFNSKKVKNTELRPFVCKKYYAEKIMSDVLTENHYLIAGKNLDKENTVLTINEGGRLNLCSLVTNYIPNYSFYVLDASQSIPLYRYTKEGKKIDNITQWALNEFRNHYSVGTHRCVFEIQREDIFHYVYGVLHNPAYRKKYELNLKREFPRIPFYNDFWFWSEKGKELMSLHLNYEEIEKWDVEREENILKSGSLNKAKLKAKKEEGIIILDEQTTLKNIPVIAWEYKLGNRSALEWILDQYKEKKPRDTTIKEKFNTYKFEDYKEEVIELLQRVCTVSVKTMEIVGEMEGMNGTRD